MAFESLWGDFEPFLDTLGHLWVLFLPSKPNFYKALVQHGLQEAFWIDFGRVQGRFGCVLVAVGLSQLKLLHHVVIS